jgi:hypothetical protein
VIYFTYLNAKLTSLERRGGEGEKKKKKENGDMGRRGV